MTMRQAACACGQLSLRCDGEPVKVSLCHCLACQRRTGAPYSIAAFFERGQVSVGGRTADYVRRADSGHEVLFHFCPVCGSTVYWEPSRMPNLIAVAPGAFADPGFPAPVQEVHVESRHHWLPPLDSLVRRP